MAMPEEADALNRGFAAATDAALTGKCPGAAKYPLLPHTAPDDKR
jgi:hypothetical protein